MASSAHGVPRTTLDVDVIAELNVRQVAPLVRRAQDDYYVQALAIHDAIQHRSFFNVVHL